jgi:nitrous oxidase accessory protein NosD
VTPRQDLSRVVLRTPPGTTFWLTRGVHRLGNHRYSQVTPKRGDRFIGAPGAVLDGRKVNLYAFTGSAPNVRIEHLTIQHFGGRRQNFNEGVVNHDAATGWKIRYNTIRDNGGAGVFVGSGNVVVRNCLVRNGQYGFSAYAPGGVRNVTVAFNEVTRNNTADWEATYDECGCTGGGKFWATRHATVRGNWVHHNRGVGLWADTNNTGFLIADNVIAAHRAEGLIYETSYNARIVRNTFVRNGLGEGPSAGFPTPAVYLSESGSDPRAGQYYGRVFLVARNRFVDNWSGVVAWENADRFAGSPSNTSTGSTTLVNPGVATEANCSNPELIGTTPYIDDCRWKTQNVRVTQNTFVFRPRLVGRRCDVAHDCGFVGVFANYGTFPEWSPYMGFMVADAITFHQNNLWTQNRYVGPWRFMAHEMGNRVSWRTWRGAEYQQDAGSLRG